MDHLQWYDYFRMIIMIMSVYCLWRLIRLYLTKGDTWSSRLLDIAWVQAGFNFLIVEGMSEQILDDIKWGPRTFLAFLVVLLSVRSCRKSDEPLQNLSK